jgi:hypothetical protein
LDQWMEELKKNVNNSTQTIYNKSNNSNPYLCNETYPNYNQINYGYLNNIFVFQVQYHPDHNQENEANEVIEQNDDPNPLAEDFNPDPIAEDLNPDHLAEDVNPDHLAEDFNPNHLEENPNPNPIAEINNANDNAINANNFERAGFNDREINAINNFARAARRNNVENQFLQLEALRNAVNGLIGHIDELFNDLLNEHRNNDNNNRNPDE